MAKFSHLEPDYRTVPWNRSQYAPRYSGRRGALVKRATQLAYRQTLPLTLILLVVGCFISYQFGSPVGWFTLLFTLALVSRIPESQIPKVAGRLYHQELDRLLYQDEAHFFGGRHTSVVVNMIASRSPAISDDIYVEEPTTRVMSSPNMLPPPSGYQSKVIPWWRAGWITAIQWGALNFLALVATFIEIGVTESSRPDVAIATASTINTSSDVPTTLWIFVGVFFLSFPVLYFYNYRQIWLRIQDGKSNTQRQSNSDQRVIASANTISKPRQPNQRVSVIRSPSQPAQSVKSNLHIEREIDQLLTTAQDDNLRFAPPAGYRSTTSPKTDKDNLTQRDRAKMFELEVAAILNAVTRHKAIVTGGSGDGGVDITLQDQDGSLYAVVQCKNYQGVVPPLYIRELATVRQQQKAQRAYLVTSGTFSEATRREAAQLKIYLIDSKKLDELRVKARRLRHSTRQHQ
ncbi:MAG: restriction endonuclease [Phototrophicaceae bacterium]